MTKEPLLTLQLTANLGHQVVLGCPRVSVTGGPGDLSRTKSLSKLSWSHLYP